MNDLDRQLAELALINKKELTSNSWSRSNTLNKKVAPAVPPKPKKLQPQVPQSYPLKQTVEPSYSSSIQNNLYHNIIPQDSGHTYSNTATLLSPQNLSYNSTYANINRPIQKVGPTPYRSGSVQSNISSLPGYGSKPELNYSNLHEREVLNKDGLVYSNLMHPIQDKTYSNCEPAHYVNEADLPLPPLDLTSNLYAPCTVNTNLPPPPDDLLPPPSPVSSSYSELRRATQSSQPYNNYSTESQASSTYESIYEPINPRPPSQMSSRSNYSLYAPYVSGGSSVMTEPSRSASGVNLNKDSMVENLTDLLVQGMDNSIDPEDVYGTCIKCKEKIVGANSGCTAMDQLYHTKCFTCYVCAINLQGKPFYALDGKPYCEEDHLNTLEKCCVCQKPILDRILRATGKPYHPGCFCCVVCGKSLDGIPFTVDATNRVHCIEDFHKIFAPRCWVCKQPIMPEPDEENTVRVVALDHSFHIQCYKCEDCGLVLSSEAEGRGCYPLDGHVLCKSCNAKRVQALTNHMTTEL